MIKTILILLILLFLFLIDVEGPQLYYLLKENLNFVFNDYENRGEEINIIDPFTKINVAKSSFQVDEIKNTFNKALFFFKFEAWKYDSNNYQAFNSTNNLTIIDNNMSLFLLLMEYCNMMEN